MNGSRRNGIRAWGSFVGLVALFSALIVAVFAVPWSFANHYVGSHWARNGHATAYATVVDDTGANWPVYAAQIRWDKAHHISAAYASSGASCSSHCVNVDTKAFSEQCHELRGVTYLQVYEGTHHLSGDTRVRYNIDCKDKLTNNQRLKVTCHEQGHVLGLAHRFTDDSCMEQAHILDRSPYPDNHDFGELENQIYDH